MHASFFSVQPARSSRKRLLLSPASVSLTTGMDATGCVCVFAKACVRMLCLHSYVFVCVYVCVLQKYACSTAAPAYGGRLCERLWADSASYSGRQASATSLRILSELKKNLRPHSEPAHTQSADRGHAWRPANSSAQLQRPASCSAPPTAHPRALYINANCKNDDTMRLEEYDGDG